MPRNRGATSLKRKRRSEDPMREFDGLPVELRAWLASAVLPWRPRSVRRAFDRVFARTRDKARALEELDRLQERLVAKDALKIKIRHSSAMLEALIAEKIKWTRDPDFGYEVVDVEAPENAALVEAVGVEILQPRRFFERTGRMDEYGTWVAKMKEERAAFLRKHSVEEAIVNAVALAS